MCREYDAIPVCEVTVNEDMDHYLYVYECGRCNGLFGLDWTWVEHSGHIIVNCPLCGEQLNLEED